MAVDTSDFRNGLKIELDGEPFTITYFQHVKPGKGGAFVRTKIPFKSDQLGDASKFLKENLEVDVIFWRGNPINIELPAFINAVVSQCDPGLKGDTASGATKPATLETGAVVQVPLFIKEGEVLRVDTRTGEYVERVNG